MDIIHLQDRDAVSISFLYIQPEVADRIINKGARRIILPFRQQPEKPKTAEKYSKNDPVKLIKVSKIKGDAVLFRCGEKNALNKPVIPCSRNTVFIGRETHKIFYAARNNCITDGSCGATCRIFKGRKFCVAYATDMKDDMPQEAKDRLDMLMRRNPIMMRQEYARMMLVPHFSQIRRLDSLMNRPLDGTGFDTPEEFLEVWDSIRMKGEGKSGNAHSSHNPWIQDVHFTLYLNTDGTFNPEGYAHMQKLKREKEESSE